MWQEVCQWRMASFEIFSLRSSALQNQVDQLGRLANSDLIRVLDEDLLTATKLSMAACTQGRRQLALDLVQQESRLEYNRGVLPATLFRNVYVFFLFAHLFLFFFTYMLLSVC